MLARRRMLSTTLFGGLLGAAIPARGESTWGPADSRTWGPASPSRRNRTAAEAEAGLTGESDQSAQASERQTQEIVDALKDIRKAIDVRQGPFTEIAGVRQKQVDYLKATNKFPDFIDVGLDVWFAIHDWHIKHLQQIVFGRDGSGRYTITLMGTQLVMRPDLVPSFISVPYDSR
jgi:hypothetical protein